MLIVEDRLRNYLSFDLLTGRMTPDHPLFPWLIRNRASLDDLALLARHPVSIDVMGLNFYPQWSTQQLYADSRGRLARRCIEPDGAGFSTLIDEYYQRYHAPILITETSAREPEEERSRWLESSVAAIKRLRGRGIPVLGYTWFPLFTMIDWEYRFGRQPVERYLLDLGLYKLARRADGGRWQPTSVPPGMVVACRLPRTPSPGSRAGQNFNPYGSSPQLAVTERRIHFAKERDKGMESTDTAFTHTHRALNAQPSRSASGGINVGDMERLASALGGAVLVLLALRRFHLATLFQGLLGSYLVYRGATGRCLVYQALGVSTAEKGLSESPSVPAPRGIRVEKSVTINCAPEEVYRFWRNFENLPRFMKHLESVTIVDDRRSHWVASGPAGSDVEWDAEILQDKENEMISWRSLGNSEVGNAGSVWFRPAPGGRGTEVRVEIEYDPPAGLLGALIARLFGEEPSEQVDEDLHRFKQVMEAGEILVTEGQPTGPRPFLPI